MRLIILILVAALCFAQSTDTLANHIAETSDCGDRIYSNAPSFSTGGFGGSADFTWDGSFRLERSEAIILSSDETETIYRLQDKIDRAQEALVKAKDGMAKDHGQSEDSGSCLPYATGYVNDKEVRIDHWFPTTQCRPGEKQTDVIQFNQQ